MRTAPPCEIGEAAISQGRVRKVPQKGYRPVEGRLRLFHGVRVKG